MNAQQIRDALIEEVETIAPDVAPVAIGDDEDMRDALDLDSMDIFNLIAAIHQRFGVEIPDADAHRFVTLGGAIGWIVEHTKA